MVYKSLSYAVCIGTVAITFTSVSSCSGSTVSHSSTSPVLSAKQTEAPTATNQNEGPASIAEQNAESIAPQTVGKPASETPPMSATVARTNAWQLDEITNLDRLGKPDEGQRKLLEKNGFFLAPQPNSAKPTAGRNEFRNRATHLFQVYERNDYIAFPSFVTADLAIDATHSYFDTVRREVEQSHLVPKLKSALDAFMREAEKVRSQAKTPAAAEQAARAVAFWGVALHLLLSPAPGDVSDTVESDRAYQEDMGEAPDQPAELKGPLAPNEVPVSVRDDVNKVTRAIQDATGSLPVPIIRADLDLTQMKPRGHYNRNGVLQRYFRSMSWLGMARFEIGREADDITGIALIARSWIGSEKSRSAMKRVLDLTTFFSGGPDAANLEAAAQLMIKAIRGAARLGADELITPANLDLLRTALADLPPPRVPSDAPSSPAPQIRVMGFRSFEDTAAVKHLIEPLVAIVEQERTDRAVAPVMGALGAASMLGSDLARERLASIAGPTNGQVLIQAIDRGRAALAQLSADSWNTDAYHGTLNALRYLLVPSPTAAPRLVQTEAWNLHQLQSFAAGWAELRHDTILYGEQRGAECDADETEPPFGWVEPLPDLYADLTNAVNELNKRLKNAGISSPTTATEDNTYYRPLGEKARVVIELLDFLKETSRKELAGEALNRSIREQIATIGGRVESLLIALTDTDSLSPRDHNMAVVADVFTWRPTAKVVEAGVGYPDLIYAVIPGRNGPVVARGAVMSYREFLQPQSDRLTDETWRKKLAAGKAPIRPDWINEIYANAVPAIALKGEGVYRCGPMSGSGLEL
jgi:hypothetical protein